MFWRIIRSVMILLSDFITEITKVIHGGRGFGSPGYHKKTSVSLILFN